MAEETFAAQMRKIALEAQERIHARLPDPEIEPQIIDRLLLCIREEIEDQAGKGGFAYSYCLWNQGSSKRSYFGSEDQALVAARLLEARLTSEESGLQVELQRYMRSTSLRLSW